MAGPYVVNSLILNITETEISSSNVIINRSQQLIPNANVGTYEGYASLGAGDNVIPLPAATVYQVYIKNIDAANKIVVKFTPNGGALVTTVLLKPGDVCIPCWCTSGDGTNGITALTLNASAAPTSVEFFLGA